VTGTSPSTEVPFRDALAFWVRLGFINFGGPTGQIAIMHDELVERRRWIDEDRFLHALNFAMLLPGPEAHQLAIYVGWLLNGSGGAIARRLPVARTAPTIGPLVYAVHGDVAWVSAIFEGLAWAVVGIVAAALLRIGQRVVKTAPALAIAAAAFVAVIVFGVPFPIVILTAGLLGLALGVRVTHVPGDDLAAIDVGRSGVEPSKRQRGLIRSVGSSVLPQLSH
jgi:chromate transporter